VKESEIWLLNHQQYLPYILFREGKRGSVILTMRNLTQHCFEDIHIEKIPAIPSSTSQYIPYHLDANVWNHFKHLLQ